MGQPRPVSTRVVTVRFLGSGSVVRTRWMRPFGSRPQIGNGGEHFSKVRVENLPPYLRIMTLTEQARSLIGIGQYEEGQRLVREAKALTGEEPKWENLLKQVHQVESQATKMP